jgi:hypothetical protein
MMLERDNLSTLRGIESAADVARLKKVYRPGV